jgi:predicted GIY-YIG superfamily endonuclease
MTVGIYKLIHTSTKKYYIGSSKNIEARIRIHMSFFRHKRNVVKLQELYDIDANFDYIILETCRVCDLKGKEKKYLRKYIKKDPLCVNTHITGHAVQRNRPKSDSHKNNLAVSMLGKNGKPRVSIQTVLVAPDGTNHAVTNVKKFAEIHNLSQSVLNGVANGRFSHHYGWRLPSTDLSMLKNPPVEFRPDIVVISPDGTKYITKNVTEFEKQHDIKVAGYRTRIKTSAKHKKGIDEYGRGWCVEGSIPVYKFQHLVTGEIIDNVISTAVLAKKLGITPVRFKRLVDKRPTHSCGGWFLPSSYIPKNPKKSVKRLAVSTTIGAEYIKNKQQKLGNYLKAPSGTIYYIPYLKLNKFNKQHGLTPSSISLLIQGKILEYFGWTVHIPQTSANAINASELT